MKIPARNNDNASSAIFSLFSFAYSVNPKFPFEVTYPSGEGEFSKN